MLFAVGVDQVGQFPLGQPADQLGRGLAGANVHPHIERRVRLERESPFGQLPAGVAEVHQDPVRRCKPFRQRRVEIGQVGLDQRGPVAEAFEVPPGQFEALGVPVESDQLRMRRAVENRGGVAAESDRRVDNAEFRFARIELKVREDFVEHHGLVKPRYRRYPGVGRMIGHGPIVPAFG